MNLLWLFPVVTRPGRKAVDSKAAGLARPSADTSDRRQHSLQSVESVGNETTSIQ